VDEEFRRLFVAEEFRHRFLIDLTAVLAAKLSPELLVVAPETPAAKLRSEDWAAIVQATVASNASHGRSSFL
jgi:hypothetical protein